MKNYRFLLLAVLLLPCVAAASASAPVSWNTSTNKYDLSGEEAAFYDSSTCTGKPAMAMVRSQVQSNLANLYPPEGGSWNDRISCIQTAENASVRVCTDSEFRGTCKDISGGKMESLVGTGYDNRISSIRKPAQVSTW